MRERDEDEDDPGFGKNRSTGLVDCEERSTHFQSSVISVPGADGGGSSTVLSTLARLISSRFSVFGSTAMLRRSAGTKLASTTRIEYRSGTREPKTNWPCSLV